MLTTEKLRNYTKPIFCVWNELQVELNGSYSIERLRQLRDYSECVTTAHCMLVLAVTPMPCLLVTILIESIPLRPPTDGIEHSFLLWVRTFALTVAVVLGFMWPCRVVVPGLPSSISPVIMAATASAVLGAAGTFGISYAIGFPLPFTLVCESGIGIFIMGMGMVAAWGRFLASDRVGRLAFTSHFTLEAMQASMVWVYPAYAYVFNQLSGGRQIAAMALLPVIKTLYKNAFARMLRERQDLQPCLVVFSVELYHVLFLSWCMNSSASKKAIVTLMLVDILEAVIVLHEIDHAVTRITSSVSGKARIFLLLKKAKTAVKYLRSPSTIPRESRSDSLLDKTKAAMGVDNEDHKLVVQVLQPKSSLGHSRNAKEPRVVPFDADSINNQPNRSLHAVKVHMTATKTAHDLSSCSSLVDLAVAAQQSMATTDSSADAAIFREFVHHSTRLLYTTEFVLLVEFTEVMIPCIYSLYLLAAYHLPNRAFLTNIHDKSIEEISYNILALLGYSSLEIVSLLVLGVILQRRTRVSVLRQLAFVLETHWSLVQANVCLWVILAMQAPLEHYGVDFSFRFKWLKANT